MSRFTPQLPSHYTDKNNGKSAKAQFMKAMQKGLKNPAEQDAKARYKEILSEKMASVQKEAMKGAKYSFQLPGTDASECRKLSKGAQEILEKVAEKQAKREQKKRERKMDKVAVKAKYFTGMQGGRIDNKGQIYDSAGQVIMKVDTKTGKIKNAATGSTLAKYRPNCGYTEHRICELIARHDTTKKDGWYAGSTDMSSIYGTNTSNNSGWGDSGSGGSSIWGDTGGFWGNKNDDNNGGWW
ncbi:MAG: hypothetical protein MRY32_08270 [Rickettsiales bacterium]|nr:hypothetical protein [Rickettsiales bacterium]